MKTCPFCAEDIQDAAIVCKHCGRELKGEEESAPTTSLPAATPTATPSSTSSQSVPRPHPFFATLRFFGLTRGVGLARGARCGAGVVLVAVGLTTGTADLGDMVSLIMTLMILATQATGALIVPVGVLVLLTGNWYLRVLAAAFSIGLFAAVAGGVDFSP